ncbi:MAG: tyrosine-type recombinase/integrase [Cyanobacteriota bacterium]|nr:tyrosine-type recombinase/integrase [Cyanobacteriota bacterium]MDY6364843.1 tyrosine-type recombinase/integrase [Cyanobacteriota bacterium]
MIYGIRKHGACKGCRTKSEALEFEAEVKNEISLIHRNKKDESDIITLKQMFKEFLEYSKANNKPTTYKYNKTQTQLLLKLWGVKTPISEITPEHLEDLKLYMKRKKLSSATYNKYFAAVSKAFNNAIRNHKLNLVNPCCYVKKLKEDNQKQRYLTREEEERLMQELSPHLKPIVICALTTGLRLSNILNLKWESIDFEYNFIEILKQENKGHKKIQIPLSEKFKKELKKIGIKKSGYVFINPKTGQPYTTIKTGFNRACERAGIENLRFHDLRHTVGTRLVANGADLQTVKEYLAHSDLKTTQRYLHPTPENMLKAVAILDKF